MYLKLVTHECRCNDVALVIPIVAIGHQQAAADEMLRSLLLEPWFSRNGAVFGKEFSYELTFRQAQPRLNPIPIYEPFS